MCSSAALTKETRQPAFLSLFILELLQEQEMYGYEITQTVKQRTSGCYEPKEGALYPLLHQLEISGIITGEWRENPGGPERKYYRLTNKGQKLLPAPPLGTQVREWLAKLITKLKAWIDK